jgi:hypothetical protein
MSFGQRAYQHFIGLGYSPHAAAALAGNAMAESGGRTTVLGDGGKAFGIFQWHPDRQQLLHQYAKRQGLDPNAETTQLGFKDWELRNNESRAGNALRAAPDLASAHNAVLASLRPAGYTRGDASRSHNYGGRLNFAQGLLGGPAMTQASNTAPAPQPQGIVEQARARMGEPAPPPISPDIVAMAQEPPVPPIVQQAEWPQLPDAGPGLNPLTAFASLAGQMGGGEQQQARGNQELWQHGAQAHQAALMNQRNRRPFRGFGLLG